MPWDLHFHGGRYFESVLRNPLGISLIVFAPVWIFTWKRRSNAAERVCLLFAVLYLAYWSASIAMIRYAIAPFTILLLLTARRALLFYSVIPRAARISVLAGAAYSLMFALCGALIIEVNGPQLRFFARQIDKPGTFAKR